MSLADIHDKVLSYSNLHEWHITIIFAIILGLISFRYGYDIWTTDDYVGETVLYNFPYADAILHGTAPYTPGTGMRWEYPPFAYLLMLIPRFFTSDVYVYEVLYVVEVAVFLVIGLILIRKIANHFGKNPLLAFITYVVCVYLLDYFIFDRFDIIVAVIVLAASYLVLKKRRGWAIFLLIFGMFVKLYPALLIPILIVPFLAKREYIPALKVLGFSILLCVLFILPFIIMAPGDVWNFMTYHSNRGLQIESVAASIVMFIGMFVPIDYFTENSYGSYNIGGDVPDSVASIMMFLMILMILISYLMYYVRCHSQEFGSEQRDFLLISLVVLMVFISFNKVFSAQYVIWVMLLLIPLMFMSEGVNMPRVISLVCVVMMIMTMWMVAGYDSLLNHEPYGIMLLFVRNVIFVGMMLYAVRSAGYLDDLKALYAGHASG